jgi:hypothetical protein
LRSDNLAHRDELTLEREQARELVLGGVGKDRCLEDRRVVAWRSNPEFP